MIEAVGYLGSALVVVSLLMTRILRLRVIGLMGSTTFLVYGLLIGSVPIVITNAVLIGINVTFLWRATRVKEWFSLLEVRSDSRYLDEFLRFYRDDIRKYQPDWSGVVDDNDITVLVLRDMQPAAAIVGSVESGVMELKLDYAIPRFNDYRMGRFLYNSNADFFTDKGVTTITAPARTKPYIRYLKKMGFTATAPGRYERVLVAEGDPG